MGHARRRGIKGTRTNIFKTASITGICRSGIDREIKPTIDLFRVVNFFCSHGIFN
jgi:hypothetical protein